MVIYRLSSEVIELKCCRVCEQTEAELRIFLPKFQSYSNGLFRFWGGAPSIREFLKIRKRKLFGYVITDSPHGYPTLQNNHGLLLRSVN